MSMPPGDVRRFKREDFEVRDYVDTITKRLVYDMTVKDEEEKNSKHNKNKEQVVLFNIKPFLTLFEGTLEELNKLQKQIEKKALAQEQDCKAEEEAYKSKLTVQSRSFEKTFAGFKELDQRIYKVGDTAVQIGDRLEALEKQRSKAVEIADLIQHFIKLNQGTAEREKNGVEEDGLTSKQASSLKKLNSFTQELERVEEEVKLTRKEREDLDYIQTAGSSGGVVGSSTNNGLGATSTAPSSQFRHLAWSLSQDPVAERLRLNEHLLDRTKEGKEAVEKESNKLENKLLQEFDEASQRNDYAKMKEVASILNEFNGCGSCVRHYIMKLNMFFDTESINMDSALAEAGEHRISTNELEDTKEDARIHAFFYDITHACKHEYEVISKVFPNPAVVMRELAQRIFEQRIGMFLEKMLNIRDSSPESLLFYLRILKSAHAETCQFVKVLQEYNIGQFDFSSMVQSLFYKYMSSYISNETKYLRLFYENHLAQLQQEAEKNRASRSWPGAPTNSKTPTLATVTALTSLEPIFAFLHCSEGAVERCLELSSKEDISQNLYQIFEMLLEYLGYRYLSPALEHALLQLKKRKSSTSPTTFFQITQQVNQIVILIQRHFHVLILPHVSSSRTVSNQCLEKKNTLLNHFEDLISQGLDCCLNSRMSNDLSKLLSSKQKKTDFRLSDDAFEAIDKVTAGCAQAVAAIAADVSVIQSNLDGANYQSFLEEYGLEVFRVLMAHLKKYPVSKGLGGVKLQRDLQEYKKCIEDEIKNSNLNDKFAMLMEVAHIHQVSPEQLSELLSSSALAKMDRADLLDFVKCRSDYRSSWLSQFKLFDSNSSSPSSSPSPSRSSLSLS